MSLRPETRTSRDLAARVRADVVRMHRRGSNVGSAMSAADVLAVLYAGALRLPGTTDPSRDRLVLSKGHAAAALYAALARTGVIDPALLDDFLADGSPLTGHPPHGTVPGIDVATGSLGQGLAIAAGMAWAARTDGRGARAFVVLGDGECQEGSVWEAAALASRLRLDNLVAIVDANGLQGYDRVADVDGGLALAPRFEAFGWAARETDGHDHDALRAVLEQVPFAPGRPSAIIARTVKGRGVRDMEDRLGWHYFNVSEADLPRFIAEIDGCVTPPARPSDPSSGGPRRRQRRGPRARAGRGPTGPLCGGGEP